MLRLVTLLLLLANAGFFAWSQGLLLPWGIGPAQQSEPQRLEQQIRPLAVRLLPAEEVRRAEASAALAPKPAECLQAVLDEARAPVVRAYLSEGWPAGTWQLEPYSEPARWIVYMGKYATAELAGRKKAELRQLGISFEPLVNASLEPGLSLGGHMDEAAATRQLDQLVERGVRTARVVQERPELKGHRLQLPAVDDALRPRLEQLLPVLAGAPLRPCR